MGTLPLGGPSWLNRRREPLVHYMLLFMQALAGGRAGSRRVNLIPVRYSSEPFAGRGKKKKNYDINFTAVQLIGKKFGHADSWQSKLETLTKCVNC